MNLEVNNKHKRAKINLVNSVLIPTLLSTTLVGLTSIALLSGSKKDEISFDVGNKKVVVDYGMLNIYDKENYYYIKDIKELYRVIDELDEKDDIESLFLRANLDDIEVFNEENFGFLRDKNLKNLTLTSININPTFLESLGSIENLTIDYYRTYQCYIDYTKIDNLKKLKFVNMNLYDYPVFLTNDIIYSLQKRGVKIDLTDVNLDDVIILNNAIDDIILNQLTVNKNSTDIQKLNSILVYILENFEYDEVVADNNSNYVTDNDYVFQFYKDGIMDAVYNRNGNIICGNYASLFQALANRVGLTSYYVGNDDHAWNMVCFNNQKFYVDSTWLDTGRVTIKGEIFQINKYKKSEDAIKNGDGFRLNWYLDSIYNITDDSHKADYIPSNNYEYVEYNGEINTEEKPLFDFDDYIYELIISSERYISNASTVLGILITLGIAFKVVKKVEKIENENKRKYR